MAKHTEKIGVLGAGMGGLFAAAYLAKAGYAVTVLEKAAYPGGLASHYRRAGRLYPTGATIAYGLESGGILRDLLDELGVPVDAEPLRYAMDVVLPDRSIALYQDRAQWEAELVRAFPERSEAVLRFWRELAAVALRVREVTRTRVAFPLDRLYQFGRLPGMAARSPMTLLRLAPYRTRTVADVLRKHGLMDYAPLRNFLDAQLIDAAQTGCEEAALLPSALALDIYRYGSFAFRGGFGAFAEQMVDCVVGLGGRVLLRSPVKEIVRQGDGAWQVETRGEMFRFDRIVNATGLENVNGGLVEAGGERIEMDEARDGSGLVHSQKQNHLKGSGEDESSEEWGAFRLDVIVSEQLVERIPAAGSLPFAWQVVPSGISALLPARNGPVYATLHESRDESGGKLPGEMLLTISVHLPAREGAGLDKAAYSEWKEGLAAAMLAEIARVLPDLSNCLVKSQSGSPGTYLRYVGKRRVGGFPLTVRQAIVKPRGSRGPDRSWFEAGERVFPGPGTLSSALSGYYAARALIGRDPTKVGTTGRKGRS